MKPTQDSFISNIAEASRIHVFYHEKPQKLINIRCTFSFLLHCINENYDGSALPCFDTVCQLV